MIKSTKILPILIGSLGITTLFALQSCNGCKDNKNTIKTPKEVIVAAPVAVAKEEVPTIITLEDPNSLYNIQESFLGKSVKGYEYLGVFVNRKLKDSIELLVLSNGLESKLIDFIEGDNLPNKKTWFDFRSVVFEKGSATLDPRSMTQINNVAKILDTYKNVELKIGGYTDNTGSKSLNKQLSEKRAKSLLKALVTKGINTNRLKAEGYGIEHPIADNNTEEGRILNRRVSARVSKK